MKPYIFKLFAFFIALVFPVLGFAVSTKDMEQARTIAAKAYIRYANDASGYLDDLNPKTMEELEAALKPKEKENIKAFKAIPVPTDYKDWDKEKLVEYWAVTAFQTKGLLEKGKGGRIRARSQINKMTLTPEPQPAAPAPAAVTENTAPLNDSLASGNPELDGLGLSMPEEEDLEASLNVEKAYNYTWVYIMVLCILVAIILAVVVYAANVLKKDNRREEENPDAESSNEHTEHLESLLADKDVEIAILKKKLESANRQTGELNKKIQALTEELSILKLAPKEKTQPQAEIGPRESSPRKPARQMIKAIYLGRANMKGIFVRADRTLNPGHSVFILETSDGYSGTFKVADSPSVWQLALSNPAEYLESACTGHDLSDTYGKDRIETVAPGTAIFEGGCWKVIRKAKIRYE